RRASGVIHRVTRRKPACLAAPGRADCAEAHEAADRGAVGGSSKGGALNPLASIGVDPAVPDVDPAVPDVDPAAPRSAAGSSPRAAAVLSAAAGPVACGSSVTPETVP